MADGRATAEEVSTAITALGLQNEYEVQLFHTDGDFPALPGSIANMETLKILKKMFPKIGVYDIHRNDGNTNPSDVHISSLKAHRVTFTLRVWDGDHFNDTPGLYSPSDLRGLLSSKKQVAAPVRNSVDDFPYRNANPSYFQGSPLATGAANIAAVAKTKAQKNQRKGSSLPPPCAPGVQICASGPPICPPSDPRCGGLPLVLDCPPRDPRCNRRREGGQVASRPACPPGDPKCRPHPSGAPTPLQLGTGSADAGVPALPPTSAIGGIRMNQRPRNTGPSNSPAPVTAVSSCAHATTPVCPE